MSWFSSKNKNFPGYKGEWKGGKPNGQGTYIFANGDRYEGRYKDGKKHGQGIYIYPNGNRVEGEW